jgi:glyoxylase-like metal-dependent hydrolase (beta-lactamase superfamily II)
MKMSESTPPIMLGMELPDVDVWSERVAVALGQNPSAFTGPGTNSYLVGTGARRLLVDPGQGKDEYLPVLLRALELTGCEGIQEIVLTHGHPDHIGGCEQVMARFGELRVSKFPWPEVDASYTFPIRPLADGACIDTEGATLRGVHTPGHAPDHLCFVLEQERAIFSGDNVLGVGTTVIPSQSGDLGDYMASLDRLLAERPTRIYPAHGPCIPDGTAKIREYIAHRLERDGQILEAMARGARRVTDIVEIVYAAYPESLHAAAGQSVTAHLRRLEKQGRARRTTDEDPLVAAWESVAAS